MTAEELKDMLPLAALGRLSAQEEAELEAALADNPQLAAQLREHEDIITNLWHSAAPLQTMPRSAWNEMRAEMHSETTKIAPILTPFSKWFSRTGWAAAIALGFVLFFKKQPPALENSTVISSTDQEEQPLSPQKNATSKSITQSSEPRNRRDQITRLQKRLAEALANRDSATLASQIIELHRPGDSSTSDPETRSKRLLALLTEALQANLRKLDEETVALIIEEGWIDVALQTLAKDAVVRHREFPTDNFQDFNLLKSEEGQYYDPVSGFLWKPALDGGGFLGSLAPDDFDLSVFGKPSEDPSFENEQTVDHTVETEQAIDSRLAELSPAQGYVIRDANGGSSTFVLSGINPTLDSISIRQSGTSAPLDPTNLLASNRPIVSTGNRTSGDALRNFASSGVIANSATPLISTENPGPQLMEVSDFFTGSIQWNEPFEVIKTDSTGTETVILTSNPE